MLNNKWYDCFLNALLEKYPKKMHLTQALMSLLDLEREAVYRRLRKDVAFPFQEVVKIASEWNISVDKVIGVDTGVVPFQMHSINYVNLAKQETLYLQQIIQTVGKLANQPDSEFTSVCNMLPRALFAGYSSLYQFYLFKWLCLYGNGKKMTPYSQVTIPDKQQELREAYCNAIKQASNTNFIMDNMIFDYLTRDIRYFHSIQLITDKEKELIKSELHDLLDYMSEIANNGCYPETQKNVTICISIPNIDTNYSYVYSKDVKACFVHVFDKYTIQSFDKDMVANFRTWMLLKKKTSFQISEVDEIRRIEFFRRQYKLVDEL